MPNPPGFLPQPEYDFIRARATRLTVDVLVVSELGVLLTCRSIEPFKGCWHTIGGSIPLGGLAKSIAVQKVKKETGLDVKILQLLDFMESATYAGGEGIDPSGMAVMHSSGPLYLAEVVGGSLQLNSEASAAHWFTKIPQHMIPWQADILRQHWMF